MQKIKRALNKIWKEPYAIFGKSPVNNEIRPIQFMKRALYKIYTTYEKSPTHNEMSL